MQSIAWMEPAILAAGLDLARLIGGRRAASLAAGAVAAMWLLSKTGSAGHTQHVRSGLWWTEDQTLRHCFAPDTPSRNAGKPFCKKPGHYIGNLVIPLQPSR